MEDVVETVLIPEDKIKERVKELGAQISKDYKGKTLTVVCILRGASLFFVDLVRELDLDVRFEFMVVSSYGSGTTSSGEVKIIQDLAKPIRDKDVLIVEDIIDSGNTMSALTKVLQAREPASVKVCAFLDKPSRRTVDFKGDYIGFTVEDKFIIGYGLDYDEKYRNLKDICVLKPEVYMK